MEDYKEDFIDFLYDKRAFQLKESELFDGRISPYYISMEKFYNGKDISKLTFQYMDEILINFIDDDYDVIFGPSYKGIPLSVATAINLSNICHINKRFAFDRKEAKTHGDARKKKRSIVGDIRDGDRIVILDDVFTSGKTKFETIDLINEEAKDLEYKDLIVGVDREEIDEEGNNAVEAFSNRTDIPVYHIVNIHEIKERLLETNKISEQENQIIENYLKEYGIK